MPRPISDRKSFQAQDSDSDSDSDSAQAQAHGSGSWLGLMARAHGSWLGGERRVTQNTSKFERTAQNWRKYYKLLIIAC
ncbi:hypothetical protein KF913_16390 [Candidatus Obscuribacterales bacterium]|nr:hypothetical protein [Candidatus Obscuribacterales bacterium]